MGVMFMNPAEAPFIAQRTAAPQGGAAMLAQMLQQQSGQQNSQELMLLQMLMADQADKRERDRFSQEMSLSRERDAAERERFNRMLSSNETLGDKQIKAALDQIKATGEAQLQAIRLQLEPTLAAFQAAQDESARARAAAGINAGAMSATGTAERLAQQAASGLQTGETLRAAKVGAASGDIGDTLQGILREPIPYRGAKEMGDVAAQIGRFIPGIGGLIPPRPFQSAEADRRWDRLVGVLDKELSSQDPARKEAAATAAAQLRANLTDTDDPYVEPLLRKLDGFMAKGAFKTAISGIRSRPIDIAQQEAELSRQLATQIGRIEQTQGRLGAQFADSPYLQEFGNALDPSRMLMRPVEPSYHPSSSDNFMGPPTPMQMITNPGPADISWFNR
ncbi:MAG: hypothetical protein ACKV2Q_36445 [Planctomycetaceae bacterium]